MSLYSITTEYRRLIDEIAEGRYADMPEEAIADTVEGIEGAWNERADAVTSAYKNLIAEVKMISDEVKALIERAEAKKAEAKRLLEYLERSMKAVGCKKFETARHSVAFRKSKSVVIDNEAAFFTFALTEHPELVRRKETIEPDKAAIKELLKTVDLPYVSISEKLNIQIK